MFITKSDFHAAIKDNILDDITELDDEVITTRCREAISYVKGELSARFDTENIFNQTGPNRHDMVLKTCIDIAIYSIHARINPRKIPKLRREAYQDAKDWLNDIKAQITNPDLPVLISDTKDYIVFGSNDKRANHL